MRVAVSHFRNTAKGFAVPRRWCGPGVSLWYCVFPGVAGWNVILKFLFFVKTELKIAGIATYLFI